MGPFLSAVSRGEFFERLSSQALRPLLPTLRLRARGGAGDGGVDLEGSLATAAASDAGDGDGALSAIHVAVLAQCKCRGEGAPVGEAAMRALAAAVSAAAAARRTPVAGLFFSATPFTRPAVRTAFAAPSPLLLAHLSLGGWQQQPPEDGGTSWRGVAAVEALAANRAWLAAFPALRLAAAPPDAELRLRTLDGAAVLLRLRFAVSPQTARYGAHLWLLRRRRQPCSHVPAGG